MGGVIISCFFEIFALRFFRRANGEGIYLWEIHL